MEVTALSDILEENLGHICLRLSTYGKLDHSLREKELEGARLNVGERYKVKI